MPISSIHNTSYYGPKYAHRAKEEKTVAEEPKTEETVPKEEPPKVKKEKSSIVNTAFSSANNDKGRFNTSSSKPSDSSSNLTRRLVAASVQFEVQQVVAAASKELVNLRITVAVSKGEDATVARSYIKKLEKLLNRADKSLFSIIISRFFKSPEKHR